MQKTIKRYIKEFIRDYTYRNNTETDWKSPEVGFASTNDHLFLNLKKVVSNNHKLPRELLKNAKTVISYFMPFKEEITRSNSGEECSKQWAIAYIETNKLIEDLNENLCFFLEDCLEKSINLPPTYNFDEKELISDWSHRHIAYIAGLGKFGLNNMLITEKGCCGRLGSLITTANIKATKKPEKEYCLYFINKSCKKCIEKCKWNALKIDSFDRYKCYEICLENAEKFKEIGDPHVCGKCSSMVPCSFENPVK